MIPKFAYCEGPVSVTKEAEFRKTLKKVFLFLYVRSGNFSYFCKALKADDITMREPPAHEAYGNRSCSLMDKI